MGKREEIANGVGVSPKKIKAVLMESLEQRQLLSTYYVSASGNDGKSGKSVNAAWRTINRVNKQTLRPGDIVLFQGRKSFSGSLYVAPHEGGTASKPVIFSSYGKGRATINSGTKAGIEIAQTAGIAITSMNFNGSGMNSNKKPGIWFHISKKNKKLSNVHIRAVEVRNYGQEGITFDINGKGGSSVSAVKIQDANLHHNLYGGLKATSMKHNVNKNWMIQRVQAHDNPGKKSARGVTGSGIYIADVDGATIQHSLAYNNGKNGAAPVGIWVAGSNRVTIQYNESYNNHTRTSTDGGGIDLDWDTNNSIVQYNYTHGNDGPGYLLCPAKKGGSNNVLRYNVSENDGRKNGVGGIQLYGNVTGAQIYNNVVYMSNKNGSSAFRAHDIGSGGKVPKNVQVRNNIFVSTGGAKVLNITAGVAKKGSIKFAGNSYHATGGFRIQWGGSGYGSLNAWRKSKGQEKLNGRATGVQGDPKLNRAGKGGTIGDTAKLRNLSAYKLKSNSPLINRGVSHPGMLSALVKLDFFGDSAIKGGKHDIGVDEAK